MNVNTTKWSHTLTIRWSPSRRQATGAVVDENNRMAWDFAAVPHIWNSWNVQRSSCSTADTTCTGPTSPRLLNRCRSFSDKPRPPKEGYSELH